MPVAGHYMHCALRVKVSPNRNQYSLHRYMDYAEFHAPGYERWQAFIRKVQFHDGPTAKMAALQQWPLNTYTDRMRVYAHISRLVAHYGDERPALKRFQVFALQQIIKWEESDMPIPPIREDLVRPYWAAKR